MEQFQIKRGLSTNLFDAEGNLLIQPEAGCWYLTVDTIELYVCIDGVNLELLNSTTEFEPNVSASTFKNLPTVGKHGLLYVVVDENATYRWDEISASYVAVGRDYTEITKIDGGNASVD